MSSFVEILGKGLPVGTVLYQGLTALGPKMYTGLPALGLKMYLGQPALGLKMYLGQQALNYHLVTRDDSPGYKNGPRAGCPEVTCCTQGPQNRSAFRVR